ncbi:MAG: hypothetical protein ACRC7Q_15115, partial [Plesiomonas shigelloides]
KINSGSEPFPKLTVAMNNLYQPEQGKLARASSEIRLAMLQSLDAKGPVYARAAAALIPNSCSREDIDSLNRYINRQPKLSHQLERALLETRQLQERCLTIIRKLP